MKFKVKFIVYICFSFSFFCWLHFHSLKNFNLTNYIVIVVSYYLPNTFELCYSLAKFALAKFNMC